MSDKIDVNVAHLQLVEIQELLEEYGIRLGDEVAAELVEFVSQAGGLDEALDLLAQLASERKAA